MKPGYPFERTFRVISLRRRAGEAQVRHSWNSPLGPPLADRRSQCRAQLINRESCRNRLLALAEREQFRIDLILMSGCQAVWRARIIYFLCASDELRGLFRRVFDGNDLVVFAVQDQGRDVDLFEVLSEVSLRERLDAFIRV